MAQKVNPTIFRLGNFQECKLKSFADRHQKYVEELVSHAIFETERVELPANPGNTYILQSFWRSVQSHSGQLSLTYGETVGHATSGYTMQTRPKRRTGFRSSLGENHSAKAIALRFHEKKQRNHRGLGFAEMLSIEHLHCRKLAYKWVWFQSPDPMMNASLICDQIVQMFESQSTPNFRKLWPKIAASTTAKAIQGVKVCCSGRLEGAEMARVETRKLGRTSAQKLSEKLDFASKKAITLYGSIGVKVWIAYKSLSP